MTSLGGRWHSTPSNRTSVASHPTFLLQWGREHRCFFDSLKCVITSNNLVKSVHIITECSEHRKAGERSHYLQPPPQPTRLTLLQASYSEAFPRHRLVEFFLQSCSHLSRSTFVLPFSLNRTTQKASYVFVNLLDGFVIVD